MPPAKRKAAEAVNNDNNASPKKKSHKMTKEEKAEAHERARQAMMGPTATTTSPKRKKAAPKSSSPKRSPKRTTKKKAAVTLPPVQDNNNNNNTDDGVVMPPPITQLQRTQSTPLELELQQQVLANVQADLEQKPPPFTRAPADHLLKFAPTQPEEGYDLPENADDSGEPWVATPSESRNTTAAAAVQKKEPTGWAVEAILILGFMYFFLWRPEGRYHGLVREFVYRLPIPRNPYRTPGGYMVPGAPCFVTNIDDPPLTYRDECAHPDAYEYLEPCPKFGICFGGTLQDCAAPRQHPNDNFLMPSASGKECVLTPQSHKVYERVLHVVQEWTLHHHCSALQTDHAVQVNKKRTKLPNSMTYDEKYAALNSGSNHNTQEDDTTTMAAAPDPYMFVTLKDTTPWTKQPMFAMETLLERDQTLLKWVAMMVDPRLQQPAVESLYQLLEATNPVRHHALKLQMLTKYGANDHSNSNYNAKIDNDHGEEIDHTPEPPPPVQQTHLVAVVPSKQTGWRHTWLSLERQCQLESYETWVRDKYRSSMKSPWLLYGWTISMTLVGVWLLLLQYFLKRAHHQQVFLEQVRHVHAFVLETLKQTKQEWEGRALKEYAYQNCPAIQNNHTDNDNNNNNNKAKQIMSQDVFDKRLWPKVVFESRADENVTKTVVVKSGNLVDVWKWKPGQ